MTAVRSEPEKGLQELPRWLQRLQEGEDAWTLVQDVVESARKRTHAQTALLLLPDPSQQYVDFAVVVGRGEDDLLGLRLRVEETVLEEPLLHATEWHFFSPQEPADNFQGVRKGVNGLRSGLAVPLPGVPYAALVVVNHKDGDAFDTKAAKALHKLAVHLPWLLHIGHLQRQMEQSERERYWVENVPHRIGFELSLQAVLSNAVSVLREIEGFCGGVWLANEEGTRLYRAQQYGLETLPTELKMETEPTAQKDLEAQWSEWIQRETEPPLHSVLVTPLRTSERVLGFLMIGSPKANAYSERVRRLLPAIASQVGLAVAHALLYEQVARRARNATALYELSVQLGSVTNVQECLALIGKTVRRLIPSDTIVVYLARQDDGNDLIPMHIRPENETLANYRPQVAQGLPGWVYAFNAPLAVSELSMNPHNLKDPVPGGFRSALAVPLQVADEAFGVILVLSIEQRLYTLSEVELLFTISNTGALTLASLWRQSP
jgi:GAF domain-containing protein